MPVLICQYGPAEARATVVAVPCQRTVVSAADHYAVAADAAVRWQLPCW